MSWNWVAYYSNSCCGTWFDMTQKRSHSNIKSYCFFWTRRFDLTRDMTNIYPFIQGSLEWPFRELFFGDVSSWNQYKYIAFNVVSCRIAIISSKMLFIKGISNEKTKELTIYGILCQNITIFYRQELTSLFQVQEKLKACRSTKLNFSSSCAAKLKFWIFEIMSIY